MVSFKEVKENEAIAEYIRKADSSLIALGYTEHSFAHVGKVVSVTEYIMQTLGFDEKDIELAKIAAYMHDIGNLVNRHDHAQSGAVMAFRILDELGMQPDEVATIVTAIGNHDEATAVAVDPVSAALIIGDKCDVRRSRVRNRDFACFDIHDRVNYSVRNALVKVDKEKKWIELFLTIDTKRFSTFEYFEIFMERMLLCRRASEKLGTEFRTYINNTLLT